MVQPNSWGISIQCILASARFCAIAFFWNACSQVERISLDMATELYYIWRKHANLFSVKQLKPKTWQIFVEFDVILRHFYGNA